MRSLLSFCFLMFLASAALAQSRAALVIGNGAYTGAPALSKPATDVAGMVDALQRLGLTVLERRDLNAAAMRGALLDFAAAMEDADLALLYYSGHSLQFGGRNRLIPVDADVAREADVGRETLRLDLLIELMERSVPTRIVLLDAGRTSPFENRLAGAMATIDAATMLGRGHARVEPGPGTYVGLAAAPGQVAVDGTGPGSPFTTALLRHLEAPGLDIRDMMARVRAEVAATTLNGQDPWLASMLEEPLVLAPAVCPVCPRTTAIPGGTTVLGSDRGGAEGPRQTQTLAGFQMSVAEITVGEIRAFEAATGTRIPRSCFVWTAEGRLRSRSGAYWGAPGFDVTEDHPAACLNWEDAQAYVDWLNTEDPRGGWRLPSEAEYEYAARGGTTSPYPWEGGAGALCEQANGAGVESRFRHRNRACNDGTEPPVPVGEFPANAYGLYHMIGNLWEWTGDCWNNSHRGALADGSVRLRGVCASRVLRGGSWDDPADNLRAAYRVGIPRTRRQANVGFRVIQDLN